LRLLRHLRRFESVTSNLLCIEMPPKKQTKKKSPAKKSPTAKEKSAGGKSPRTTLSPEKLSSDDDDDDLEMSSGEAFLATEASRKSNFKDSLTEICHRTLTLIECDLPHILSELEYVRDQNGAISRKLEELMGKVEVMEEAFDRLDSPAAVAALPGPIGRSLPALRDGMLYYDDLDKSDFTIKEMVNGCNQDLAKTDFTVLIDGKKRTPERKMWTKWVGSICKHPKFSQYLKCDDYRAQGLKICVKTAACNLLCRYMVKKLHITNVDPDKVKSAVGDALRQISNNAKRSCPVLVAGSDDESPNQPPQKKQKLAGKTKKQVVERNDDDKSKAEVNKAAQKVGGRVVVAKKAVVKKVVASKVGKKDTDAVTFKALTDPESIQRGKELLGLTGGGLSGVKVTAKLAKPVSVAAPTEKKRTRQDKEKEDGEASEEDDDLATWANQLEGELDDGLSDKAASDDDIISP
jgi:hypothetical protein